MTGWGGISVAEPESSLQTRVSIGKSSTYLCKGMLGIQLAAERARGAFLLKGDGSGGVCSGQFHNGGRSSANLVARRGLRCVGFRDAIQDLSLPMSNEDSHGASSHLGERVSRRRLGPILCGNREACAGRRRNAGGCGGGRSPAT